MPHHRRRDRPDDQGEADRSQETQARHKPAAAGGIREYDMGSVLGVEIGLSYQCVILSPKNKFF